MASLVAQLVKNPPAMWETWVQSLGWEDPLEKEKATHSSILAWTIPWTMQSVGLQRTGHDCATFAFTFFHSVSRVFSVKLSYQYTLPAETQDFPEAHSPLLTLPALVKLSVHAGQC